MRRQILRGMVLLSVAACVVPPIAGAAATAPAAETAKLGVGVDEVELVDEAGKTVKWSGLNGKRRAVFFGFTNCPVICPVTVWELENALLKLGKKGKSVDVVFVTLDPERDTPAVLKSYFSGFKVKVRGVSGTTANINRVAKAFGVQHERVAQTDGGYSLDHTAAVFLLNERGTVVDTVAFGTPADVIERRLKALISAPPAAP